MTAMPCITGKGTNIYRFRFQVDHKQFEHYAYILINEHKIARIWHMYTEIQYSSIPLINISINKRLNMCESCDLDEGGL